MNTVTRRTLWMNVNTVLGEHVPHELQNQIWKQISTKNITQEQIRDHIWDKIRENWK